jgi:hypothetical protein
MHKQVRLFVIPIILTGFFFLGFSISSFSISPGTLGSTDNSSQGSKYDLGGGGNINNSQANDMSLGNSQPNGDPLTNPQTNGVDFENPQPTEDPLMNLQTNGVDFENSQPTEDPLMNLQTNGVDYENPQPTEGNLMYPQTNGDDFENSQPTADPFNNPLPNEDNFENPSPNDIQETTGRSTGAQAETVPTENINENKIGETTMNPKLTEITDALNALEEKIQTQIPDSPKKNNLLAVVGILGAIIGALSLGGAMSNSSADDLRSQPTPAPNPSSPTSTELDDSVKPSMVDYSTKSVDNNSPTDEPKMAQAFDGGQSTWENNQNDLGEGYQDNQDENLQNDSVEDLQDNQVDNVENDSADRSSPDFSTGGPYDLEAAGSTEKRKELLKTAAQDAGMSQSQAKLFLAGAQVENSEIRFDPNDPYGADMTGSGGKKDTGAQCFLPGNLSYDMIRGTGVDMSREELLHISSHDSKKSAEVAKQVMEHYDLTGDFSKDDLLNSRYIHEVRNGYKSYDRGDRVDDAFKDSYLKAWDGFNDPGRIAGNAPGI